MKVFWRERFDLHNFYNRNFIIFTKKTIFFVNKVLDTSSISMFTLSEKAFLTLKVLSHLFVYLTQIIVPQQSKTLPKCIGQLRNALVSLYNYR